MLITIDTQRIAETLAAYVKASRECEASEDWYNAKVWKDRFDNAVYFLWRLGIDAYHDEDLGTIKVETEDMHLLG